MVEAGSVWSTYRQPLIREFTQDTSREMRFHKPAYSLMFNNTNPLVKNPDWDVRLSKTGYTDEAGRCLLMRAKPDRQHREMASALSCPVGFKNGTDGNTRIAIDAVRAARHSHIFYSPDKDGKMTIYRTAGNPYGHVILRGGHRPNYDTASIDEACEALAQVGLPERLVVDFSHGNSMKDHRRQLLVAQDICDQLRRGRTGIAGIMAESFLVEGRQDVENGCAVTFGQSITDACLSWADTETLLAMLAEAAQVRLDKQKA